MAILHVRNVPDELYTRIQKLADEANRSITAEVIQLLSHGVQACEARQAAEAIIKRIRQRTQTVRLPPDWKDSAELLREDRSR